MLSMVVVPESLGSLGITHSDAYGGAPDEATPRRAGRARTRMRWGDLRVRVVSRGSPLLRVARRGRQDRSSRRFRPFSTGEMGKGERGAES